MPNGSLWPRVSIVTPSFNQGKFLEETIRSVLLQGYPDLEYIIIDGGSSDESVNIIKTYQDHLTFWQSEKDRGQTDAIAKGFDRSTGEIIAWLNSDDLYIKDMMSLVGSRYRKSPDSIIAGDVINFNKYTRERSLVKQSGISLETMVKFWEGRYRWHQPGLFFPNSAYRDSGGLDIELNYMMDYDLVCRLLIQGLSVEYLNTAVAMFRLHETSKTCSQSDRQKLETSLVSQRYWDSVNDIDAKQHDRHMVRSLLAYGRRHLRSGHIGRSLSLVLKAFKIDFPAALMELPRFARRHARRLFR